ncbi:MAG: cytidine deaminase [Candidatus Delongbacteria bacterium]|jgi:cytidine deaminase|nr:cytidine deaminase [Candidatus Delongbacteria bacterium]
MKQEELHIQYQRYNYQEIPENVKELLEHARDAIKRAYAPYSKFRVGAAVRLGNGVIITGNNQENVAYPSGLCAERVALFYANAKYPDVPVLDLLVMAESGDHGITKQPVSPCGSCRQVLQETELRYNNDIRVMLAGKDEIWIFENGSQLLPLNFTDDFLP